MFSDVPHKEKDCWYTIPQIRARKSEIHGLGLFAIDTIPNGTMIERSPLIVCDRYTYKCLDDIMGYRHVLSDYPFKWNRHESAFALGYSGLINHSHEDPNVFFKFNYKYPAIEFYAKRTIKEGEELASLHKQIVIKVPMIEEGVKAIRYFTDKGLCNFKGEIIK